MLLKSTTSLIAEFLSAGLHMLQAQMPCARATQAVLCATRGVAMQTTRRHVDYNAYPGLDMRYVQRLHDTNQT
jgi:hypothetical protein